MRIPLLVLQLIAISYVACSYSPLILVSVYIHHNQIAMNVNYT